jgi:hypothetical protein
MTTKPRKPARYYERAVVHTAQVLIDKLDAEDALAKTQRGMAASANITSVRCEIEALRAALKQQAEAGA